jgi:hypothetical protein
MSEALAGLAGMAMMMIVLAAVLRRRQRVAKIAVDAEPDAALLSSAAALRRLGARITRYDSEAGTLEAQVPPAGIVRVRAAADGERTTLVHVEADPAARSVVRRFRGALSA